MGFATHELVELLKGCATEAVENLAFTELACSPSNRIEGPSDGFKGARISLGTLGCLDLIISRGFLSEIARFLFNHPGEDADPDMLEDTMNEVLNIIAGRFLFGMSRGKSDFSLGLPSGHLDIEEWNSLPLRLVMVTDAGRELAIGLKPLVGG